MQVAVGLLVLLAALVFIPARFDAMNFFDPPKRLVWAVLAVLLSVCCWNRSSRVDRRVAGLTLALAGWMILRSLWRPVPSSELEVLFAWCLPVILFIVAKGSSTSRLRIIGGFLLVAGLVQTLLMVLQRFGMDPVFAATTSSMDYAPGRMVGTIGYQNQAVDVLALSAVGSLFLTSSLRGFFICQTLFLPVIVLTGNRGGILAFVVAILLSGTLSLFTHPRLQGNRHRFSLAAGMLMLGLCVMVTAIALVPETAGRFREAFTDFRKAPAIQSRLYMARIGWQMFKERPLTGWGAGEYAMQYPDRLGSILPVEKNHAILQSVVFAREAHNDPLQFAAEFGLIGLALLAGLILAGWLCFSRQEGVLRWQGIAVTYGFSYMAVASLFSFPWQSAMAGPLAGFLMGLLLPARQNGSGKPPKILDWFAMKTRNSLSRYGSAQPRPPFDHREGLDMPSGGRTCGEPHGIRLSSPQAYSIPQSWKPLAKPLASRCVNATVLVASLLLLSWYGRECFLNVAIPTRLAGRGSEGAERLLTRVDYRYQALIGASLAAQGNFDSALVRLNHAWRGYRDVLLWNNLGHVMARTGEWRKALSVYTAWAASGLDHANALKNLSLAHEQVGDFHEAARSAARRMAMWPDAVSTHDVKRLAVLQLQAGSPQEAALTLRRYRSCWTQAEPRIAAEIENLAGSISRILGDKDQAAGWFRSALERYPDLESARRNLDAL